jgi:hypothetical protein
MLWLFGFRLRLVMDKYWTNKPLDQANRLHVKVAWSRLKLSYCPIAHPMNPPRSNLPGYSVFPEELPQLVTRKLGFICLW